MTGLEGERALARIERTLATLRLALADDGSLVSLVDALAIVVSELQGDPLGYGLEDPLAQPDPAAVEALIKRVMFGRPPLAGSRSRRLLEIVMMHPNAFVTDERLTRQLWNHDQPVGRLYALTMAAAGLNRRFKRGVRVLRGRGRGGVRSGYRLVLPGEPPPGLQHAAPGAFTDVARRRQRFAAARREIDRARRHGSGAVARFAELAARLVDALEVALGRGGLPHQADGFAFEGLVLLRRERSLLRDGEAIEAELKALDLLVLLAGRAGRSVDFAVIEAQLWGDDDREVNVAKAMAAAVRHANRLAAGPARLVVPADGGHRLAIEPAPIEPGDLGPTLAALREELAGAEMPARLVAVLADLVDALADLAALGRAT